MKSLKIGTLGYFHRKYIMFGLKRYRGDVSLKMANDFRNDISNFMNFDTSS